MTGAGSRQQFALNFLNESDCFWENIIFGNEILLGIKTNGQIVGYTDYSLVPEETTVVISIWACVSITGPRIIRLVKRNNLDIMQFKEILEDLSTVCNEKHKFADGNTRNNRFVQIEEWFNNLPNLQFFPWPPNSDDLMPMTIIFRRFINELNFRMSVITNAEELWTEVKEFCTDFITDNDLINFAIKPIPILLHLLISDEQ